MTATLVNVLAEIQTEANICAAPHAGWRSPDPQLLMRMQKFVNALKIWLTSVKRSDEKNGDYAININCLHAFLTNIKTLSAKYKRIPGFNSTVMLMIPWEQLPEAICKEHLNHFFANKEDRLAFWQDYLAADKRTVQQLNTAVTLGMNKRVATALLGYDDIQIALLASPIERVVLFFRLIPRLLFKVPIYDFWVCAKKGVTSSIALAVLNPLASLHNTDLVVRFKACFYMADIYMAERQKFLAKPYLDALRNAGDALTKEEHRAVLMHQSQCHTHQRPFLGAASHLSQAGRFFQSSCYSDSYGAADGDNNDLMNYLIVLNQRLVAYLGDRNTSSLFYSLGIKNARLSSVKNEMVKALRSDISGYIATLKKGELIDVAALEARLACAEKMNEGYYKTYKRVFDGVGTLASTLRNARENVQEFFSVENIQTTPILGSSD